MHDKLIVAGIAAALWLAWVPSAQAADAPRIVSWSNSKTGNEKTVFQVKPGEKISFSVKAEGAEKHLWLVDKVLQRDAKGSSFTWTVPDKKGMWKILLKTTNKTRQEWVEKQEVFWNKWVKVFEYRGKRHTDKREAFIHGMRENRLYPLKARKEWIVSTFLTTVKPGESIQKAIDSIPSEGGIVELAPGTHDVNDTMYPPGTFHRVYKNLPIEYSILIKRSNITICGSRKSVVRHHNKDVNCFLIPDLEATDTDLYLQNITFRGFTTTSAYKKRGKKWGAMIKASHVKNFTVEDIHDTSWMDFFMSAGAHSSRPRYNENVYVRNNLVEHSGLGVFTHCRNIHVLGNTLLGGRICTDMRLSNVYITGNSLINTRYLALLADAPLYSLISDNFVQGGRGGGIRITQGGYQILVENNTITGAQEGIFVIAQSPMRNVLIRNNRIYNSKYGIYAGEYRGAHGKGHVTITNNTIYDNGDGIRKGTEHIILDVSNNIIANSKGYGINRAGGESKIILSHNNVWNNTKGNYNGCAAGPGDFSKDPLFANPANGDFHLKSKAGRWDPKAKKWVKDNVHSPCIDAGDPKADFSKEPVPNGGKVNVGAYGNTKEASKSTAR